MFLVMRSDTVKTYLSAILDGVFFVVTAFFSFGRSVVPV